MAKTGRAVIVHEAPRTAGFGAEVAALPGGPGDPGPARPRTPGDRLRCPLSVLVARGPLHPERGPRGRRAEGGTELLSDPHLIRLPDLGEGLTGAEVIRWLVRRENSVSRDQPLVEVETDKAVVQIPSPVAGTVKGLLAAEGAQASVGDALAEIVAEHDGNRAGPRALPRVRALASELGVDLAVLRPDRATVTRGGRSRGRAGLPPGRGHAR